MHKTIVITDLTQMPKPNEVCVVGVDEQNQSIRPVLPGGVLKRHLYVCHRLVMRPRAKIELKFYSVPIEPPHVEDLGFDPNSIVYKGLCTDVEWEKVLQDSSYSTVDNIYDGLLHKHRWVEARANTRSIGTLSQVNITAVQLPMSSGKLKYQLSFKDKTGFLCRDIPISDLAFRELSFAEVKKCGRNAEIVAQEITAYLKTADRVYLRIGLARPWVKEGTKEEACWTQVTGIYTFPDYLAGKSFADF
jgi:hypothetical protein